MYINVYGKGVLLTWLDLSMSAYLLGLTTFTYSLNWNFQYNIWFCKLI